MKKGASHLDWAISISIFIVYLVALFIFLKPAGNQEDLSGLNLIVRDNLIKDVHWQIKKVPLFVNTTFIGDYGVRINFTNFVYNWNNNNMFILDESGNNLRHEIEEAGNEKYLKFDAILFSKINVFWIYGSNDLNLVNDPPVSTQFLTSPTDFTYIFGVPENLEGINKDKFNSLGDYNILRDKWKYPTNRDFIINIYNNERLIYQKTTPTRDKDVNVIRLNDFILYDNGTKEDVIMEIRTW